MRAFREAERRPREAIVLRAAPAARGACLARAPGAWRATVWSAFIIMVVSWAVFVVLIWAASAAFGAVLFCFNLGCFGTALNPAGEQSGGAGAQKRARQLRREAYPVLVRHSNKARTSIAFLVSYTARLELGKIISRA